MRAAIISDIRANAGVLDAVLEDLDREGPDTVLCLGDVALTGPRPKDEVARPL